MFFTVLLITFDAMARSKNHSIVINYNMLAFKWNPCGANRFSHLWETGDSLRDIKIRFLSITFELPMRSLCWLQTKVWHYWDLSYDIQLVQIGAELYEKIELQDFYYFAYNFYSSQPIAKLFNIDLLDQ